MNGVSSPRHADPNANAAKLYKTHMDVDYIAESPSTLDGHLGSTIDRYTHHDRYDYILEVEDLQVDALGPQRGVPPDLVDDGDEVAVAPEEPLG